MIYGTENVIAWFSVLKTVVMGLSRLLLATQVTLKPSRPLIDIEHELIQLHVYPE